MWGVSHSVVVFTTKLLFFRLFPTLLAWLFKRKYHIKLKISRISVLKLILKDVSLSKDGYLVVSSIKKLDEIARKVLLVGLVGDVPLGRYDLLQFKARICHACYYWALMEAKGN